MTSVQPNSPQVSYPHDPLDLIVQTDDYKRRIVSGVLESYNSNYDFLSEAVQNAVDALEDAKLMGLPGPYRLAVTVDLKENAVSILDTGVGLSEGDLTTALAPHVSLKSDADVLQKRGAKNSYRGYKGVGLTLLAYGTDDLRIHSKRQNGELVALRMRYGNAWARATRKEPATVDLDAGESPLKNLARGTFVRLQLSTSTRPKSLRSLTPHPEAWAAIMRTRTAIGQVLIGREAVVAIDVSLKVITAEGEEKDLGVDPKFLYPTDVDRTPRFRFLNLDEYYAEHPQRADIPDDLKRQDGVYFTWDTERIRKEYTASQLEAHGAELDAYQPTLFAFVPYQGSVWGEINQILSDSRARTYLYPGLVLAVNRQRLADVFPIEASRWETFSRNVLVIVHFDNAQPDQGRKTVQEEVLDSAKAAADRAVLYLSNQRAFLRPVGETPSAQQRQVEKNKQDWEFNVQMHQRSKPLHIPPVTLESEPLTEQDVVALFHQLCALDAFPGIHVLATSQSQTYDSLVFFRCPSDSPGLAVAQSPLGLAPSVLGAVPEFQTRNLTLEFKNNLDALIDEFESNSRPKQYQHVDICVCWSTVQDSFAGYDLSEIGPSNLDRRRYPGATHLLQRDGEFHVIQVVMLSAVRQVLESGTLRLRT